MIQETIGFIGGGNMATALIGGLIEGGISSETIWVSDPDREKLQHLKNQYRINTSTENKAIAGRSKVLVIAVKPQVLQRVTQEISQSVLESKPIVISIAAGVREVDLERWLGGSVAIVRCMPNTPALVRTGATAMHANAHALPEQRDIAESVLRSVGVTVWVDNESCMDSVTALSGSGPAYFFLLMEAMEEVALEFGIDPQTARLLVEQTAFGAAKVALEVSESPGELRSRVTSPGGTTQRALEVFEDGDMRALVANALRAARARSIEMSNELGGK